jgi:hypothetical protein
MGSTMTRRIEMFAARVGADDKPADCSDEHGWRGVAYHRGIGNDDGSGAMRLQPGARVIVAARAQPDPNWRDGDTMILRFTTESLAPSGFQSAP